MEAKELKIGNLVFVPSAKQILPITAINMDLGVVVNRSLRLLGFDQIEPIELTEEWLLNLGFEKKAENNFRIYVNARGIIHAYTKGKVEIELGNKSGYSFGYPQVYYVHQLQNLYFALTSNI